MFHIRHVIKFTLSDWLSYLEHSESYFMEIVQNISVNSIKTKANLELKHTPDCSPRWPLQFGIKMSILTKTGVRTLWFSWRDLSLCQGVKHEDYGYCCICGFNGAAVPARLSSCHRTVDPEVPGSIESSLEPPDSNAPLWGALESEVRD